MVMAGADIFAVCTVVAGPMPDRLAVETKQGRDLMAMKRGLSFDWFPEARGVWPCRKGRQGDFRGDVCTVFSTAVSRSRRHRLSACCEEFG